MITVLLTLLLYAIVAAICLEILFWAIGLFLPVPPRIRQLLYALAGVMLLIEAFQIFMGGSGLGLPYLRR